MLCMATKAVIKILHGLATCAHTSLGDFTMDKVLGRGQKGDFLIPQDKTEQLIRYT